MPQRWFPQYLKSVHGFDLAKIGITAWIAFVTANLGNMTATATVNLPA